MSDDILPPELSVEQLMSLAVEKVAEEVNCPVGRVVRIDNILEVQGQRFTFRPAIAGRGQHLRWVALVERVGS